MPTAKLESYLRSAAPFCRQAHNVGQMPGKEIVGLSGGVRALSKPTGKYTAAFAKCEVAAWRLASAIGWGDLVPATVLREDLYPTGIASLQVWTPSSPGWQLTSVSDDDIVRGAVFDLLVRNRDRSMQNVLCHSGHLILIDHAQTFCPPTSTIHSVLIDEFKVRGLEAPEDLRTQCREAVAKLGTEESFKGELLTADQFQRIEESLDQLDSSPNLSTVETLGDPSPPLAP